MESIVSHPKRSEKLRIPVRGTNRKFYLVPPTPASNRPDYYVRFEVPRELREADPKLPKTIFQSTGTDILGTALIRARDKIEDVFEPRWQQKKRGKQLKAERVAATIDELLERYEPMERDVNADSAARNKGAVRLYARELTGRGEVGTLPVDRVFTAAMRRRFAQQRLEQVKGLNLMAQESAANTINTTLAMVQSVISPEVMDFYRDLNLNLIDLAEFRAVPRLKTDKRHVAYRRLPQECVEAMEREALLLKAGTSPAALAAGLTAEQQKGVYVVYLLMSRLGLRNIEAFHARWSWIERSGKSEVGTRKSERGLFVIERRADFVPKNKSDRTIEMEPALLTSLDEFPGLPDAWIVPGANAKARYDACHNHINAWLRLLLPAKGHVRGKGAYRLRKEAGSRIADRPESEGGGIQAAADFLGDTVATTEKYYRGRRRTVAGVKTSELAAA